MDLFSLASITVILIIVVGGYLIFTDLITGRPKLIMIAFLGVLAIMLVSSLSLFKQYYELVDTPTAANIETIIAATDLPAIKSGSSFSISTWIYIQDWNYRFGYIKNILTYNQPGASQPLTLNLDAFENNLIVNYNTFSSSSASSSSSSSSSASTSASSSSTSASSSSDAESGVNQIVVNNVNIQKWVNIVCCFSANKIDTYINGKLVDTTVNQLPLYTTSIQGDITLGKGGGYSGTISNSRYYSKFLSPSEIWDIYTAGYSDNLLGNFMNRYKASFVFYQDNNIISELTL